MGMPVTVHVVDRAASTAVLDQVFEDFRALDDTFSLFKPGSAISRINRGELRVEDAGDLVAQALQLCSLYEATTDGHFSASLGGILDPSGLVKGWAIDRAASTLVASGFQDFFVDAGGDVQTRGLNELGEPWRIGIRHPRLRDKVVRVISARNVAVATSGTYEKGNHILDPRTGLPATELVSLTVVGPDILEADVYATAAFAMGKKALDFIERTPGYEAYVIARDADHIGMWTSGFASMCKPMAA